MGAEPMSIITSAGIAGLLALVAASGRAAPPQHGGWTIPADAPHLISPHAVTAALLKKGAGVYRSSCEKCHGVGGRGDGRYADPGHPPADLTDRDVAAEPEGVIFYKVWNGKKPMPAFKTVMTADEVWAVVAYVETLGPSSTAPAAGR